MNWLLAVAKGYFRPNSCETNIDYMYHICKDSKVTDDEYVLYKYLINNYEVWKFR